MPFKSSKSFEVGKFLQSQLSRKTILGQGVGGGGGGVSLEKVSATGGTKSTPGDGNVYHYFTSSDTFSVTQAATDQGVFHMILVSGGGGGSPTGFGPGGVSGGGAGGGIVYASNIKFSVGDYSITVGGGGAAGANGTASQISHPQFNVSHLGGGTGDPAPSPSDFANGGGGATPNRPGLTGTSVKSNISNPLADVIAYIGGNTGSPSSLYHGGGGAGALTNGTMVPQPAAANFYSIAGDGMQFLKIPTAFFNNGGAAGGGAGGRNSFFGSGPAVPGAYGGPTANGGGGGVGYTYPGGTATAGGSGAVLIWYPELRAA